jgi:hypothetical protein
MPSKLKSAYKIPVAELLFVAISLRNLSQRKLESESCQAL